MVENLKVELENAFYVCFFACTCNKIYIESVLKRFFYKSLI